MKSVKFKPLDKIQILLTILSIGAIIKNPNTAVVFHLLSTLGTGLLLFWLLTKFTKKKKNIQNCIISCLILFLVLDYKFQPEIFGFQYTIAVLATTLTILIKFFFQYKGGSIINPVVLALLITSFTANSLASWWGTNYQLTINEIQIPFALILLGIWGIFFLKDWRKLPLALSFLLPLLPILYFTTNLEFLKFIYSDGTIYFFTTIMLIDPKSSPILKKDQIIFGIIAALAYSTLLKLEISNHDLLAIAIANLYFFSSKLYKLQKTKKSSA